MAPAYILRRLAIGSVETRLYHVGAFRAITTNCQSVHSRQQPLREVTGYGWERRNESIEAETSDQPESLQAADPQDNESAGFVAVASFEQLAKKPVEQRGWCLAFAESQVWDWGLEWARHWLWSTRRRRGNQDVKYTEPRRHFIPLLRLQQHRRHNYQSKKACKQAKKSQSCGIKAKLEFQQHGEAAGG